jgi:fermentation-respiration switch protein FrsA (DUF1100 family)
MTTDWPALAALAWRLGRIAIVVLALSWLFVLGLLWAFQRNMLYMAPRALPGPAPAGYAAVGLETADGLMLTAWYRPAAQGQPTFVFFSGQGASLLWSAEWSEGFAQAGIGLLLVSFRGFDGNPGSPDEQGLYRDGRAALAWLAAHGIRQPVLVGLSLGSGVAAQMAVEAASPPPDWPLGLAPIGLILLSPYESIPDMAAMRYPIFPVRSLVRDRFDTLAKADSIRLPVLLMHGEQDELIPFAQGRAVYDRITAPKWFVGLAGIGHNYPSQIILPQVESFLASLPANSAD